MNGFNGAAIGIELGSTRIKAVLLDESHRVLASGERAWENRFENNLWTYSLDEVWSGIQSCYGMLKKNVKAKYNVTLRSVGAIGISAMMHGYLVFDQNGEQLVPFRTWRNNNAEEAARELTELFQYPIPARWSAAHLWQAIKDGEPHVRNIAFQTSLEGYIHHALTGKRVIGIGEASGMFPVDAAAKDYDKAALVAFNTLLSREGMPYRAEDILPKVLVAGEPAGRLTAAGAALLDPEGDLEPGIPLCPPEGDAGTGMVATNSIKKGTGNISAGTSIFAMLVLEGALQRVHPEVDLVTTPDGKPVAMVHGSNCTSEINAWMDVFAEVIAVAGNPVDKGELYTKLFTHALSGEVDCGGLVGYNYVSGEHITGVAEGRPLFVRTTESAFTLSNFMRMQIYSAFAALRLGLDILTREEGMHIKSILAHGGIFKTKGVAQRFLAAAIQAPVSVNGTANEGGPFGIAVLAMYLLHGKGMPLEQYLDECVFTSDKIETIEPHAADALGFSRFMERYVAGLPIVRTAVDALKR